MVAQKVKLSELKTVEQALMLTVGVSKGGTGKSWVATNLAATLARRGHHTVLVDTNTAANAYRDWCVMAYRGQNPGYHCYFHPRPFEDGTIDELRAGFDVVVIDTPQYRNVGDVSRAWEEADALIAPVTEEAPDFDFFFEEVTALQELRGDGLTLVLPTRCTMLKRQTITQDFHAFLGRLEEAGIYVPHFEKANFYLDYNQRVKSLPVRNIYYKPGEGETCKQVTEWVHKWEAHVDWILEVIKANGTTLPAPQGTIDAIEQFNETVTDEIRDRFKLVKK